MKKIIILLLALVLLILGYWFYYNNNAFYLDGGEQPGWTLVKGENCGSKINSKEEAGFCLEEYENRRLKKYFEERGVEKEFDTKIDINNIDLKSIKVKLILIEGEGYPEPLEEYYEIEVYKLHNTKAVDKDGNIYYFQTFA